MATYRYQVYFGLSGCYMPDSHYGVFEGYSRKQLAGLIRDVLAFYDLPASLFADAGLRSRWSFIKRNGSSSAHFHLYHGANCLTFSGMTEDEYKQASLEDAA